MLTPFHLAYHVTSLDEARAFYGGVLGCREGRSTATWVDFDFFGHQVSAHVSPDDARLAGTNPVDGDDVPVRHFGLVLAWGAWEALRDRLRGHGVEFLIEPHVRFRGEIGEQATLFVRDPSGNALEFKAFRDDARLFASG